MCPLKGVQPVDCRGCFAERAPNCPTNHGDGLEMGLQHLTTGDPVEVAVDVVRRHPRAHVRAAAQLGDLLELARLDELPTRARVEEPRWVIQSLIHHPSGGDVDHMAGEVVTANLNVLVDLSQNFANPAGVSYCFSRFSIAFATDRGM